MFVFWFTFWVFSIWINANGWFWVCSIFNETTNVVICSQSAIFLIKLSADPCWSAESIASTFKVCNCWVINQKVNDLVLLVLGPNFYMNLLYFQFLLLIKYIFLVKFLPKNPDCLYSIWIKIYSNCLNLQVKRYIT